MRQGKIGIKDVAQLAGVSFSSVSRVLDGHAEVSESMRRRVMEAVRELGYTPDPLAQSMRTGQTLTIGFAAGDTSNPLIAQIALAAQLALRRAGYSLLIANSGNDPEQEDANIQLLKNRRVDGLLLSVADETNPAVRQHVADTRVPVVLVDRTLEGIQAGAIHSEHAVGITSAAEHLIALGHRRIALISGNPRVRPSRERATALRAALAAVPGGVAIIAPGSFTEEHGYDAAMALLQRADRPTAIIAGANQLLVGVLRAVRDLSVRIPQDLSLVTCDRTALAELFDPPIATIGRDPSEIGRSAAELLLDQIAGGAAEVRTLPTDFSPGASLAAPAEGNP